MKLEYLQNTGDDLYSEIIRLFDFEDAQTTLLKELVEEKILKEKQELHLHEVDFVRPLNCKLSLRQAPSRKGVYRLNANHFCLEMSIKHFEGMIEMLAKAPTSDGCFWLDGDVESEIGLLLSQGGGW